MNAAAVVILAAFLAALAVPPVRDQQQRRRADRQLARLARIPAPRTGDTAMTDDPRRSPDWCWTHNCHRSACPTPQH